MADELQTHDCPVLFIPRAAWGLTNAEANRRGLVVQAPNRPRSYIHHQGAGNVTNDPVVWMQGLDRYARVSKGMRAVHYDIGITRVSGGGVVIIEGRGIYVGGATEDENNESQATVLSGNRASISATTAEIDAYRWLDFAMQRADWIEVPHSILGHRDNPDHPNNTSCPGDAVYVQLSSFRVPWIVPEFPLPDYIPLEDDMPLYFRFAGAVYALKDSGGWRPVDGVELYKLARRTLESVPELNQAELDALTRKNPGS